MKINFLDPPNAKGFIQDNQNRSVRAIEFVCPHGEVVVLYVTAGPAFHLNPNPDRQPKAWHYEIHDKLVSITPSIDLTKDGHHPAECHFHITNAEFTEFYDEPAPVSLNNNLLQNATMSQTKEPQTEAPNTETTTAEAPAETTPTHPEDEHPPVPGSETPGDDATTKEIEIDCSTDYHYSESDGDGRISFAVKNFKIKATQDNPIKLFVTAEFVGDADKARAFVINQGSKIIAGLFKGCKLLQS